MLKDPEMERHLDALGQGPLRWFRDWPDPSTPSFGAGVYTIWSAAGSLVYVGMSGRSITAGMPRPNRPHGLVTRLGSHAQGRRSGDQFCVYVADRLVLPGLSADDIASIGAGHRSFDAFVRRYIHEHLGYRYSLCADGVEALALERRLRKGGWPHGKPSLNPA
jgi:hypothetical protein